MSGSLLFCICFAYFVLAYFIYGRYLKRLFAIDPKNPTPAMTETDGIDYVPTPRVMLFGHHFASIAGPGPIVGPIMAAYFGWLPALLWILIGCVFVGAFHDFAALVISVRNKGRSISFVMEKVMGFTGRQLFLCFSLLSLILVVAVFTLLIANMFTEVPEVATASMLFIFIAPLFSLCTGKLKFSLRNATLIFLPLVFLSVWVGDMLPIDLPYLLSVDNPSSNMIWVGIIAVYIFVASVIPIHWLLQPRDYMNFWLLIFVALLGVISIFAYSPEIKMEAFSGWQAVTADGNLTYIVPALFIFISCGACSGFHALVASGTTSKQIRSESDALPIGYGAMLVEGIMGVMALISVMSMDFHEFFELGKNPAVAFANGISRFCDSLDISVNYANTFISLAISAFMMTSLDTATRLGRFLIQELFMPRCASDSKISDESKQIGSCGKFFSNKYVASFILVVISLLMALSGEAGSLWPIFGASNQLMAALTLLVVSLWLLARNVNWLVAFIPMILMMFMSLWGVVQVLEQQWSTNYVLAFLGIVLIAMSLLMICLGCSIVAHNLKNRSAL